MELLLSFPLQGKGPQATQATSQSQHHTNPLGMRTAFQTRTSAGTMLHPHPLLHLPPLTTAAMTITTPLTVNSLVVAVAAAAVLPQPVVADISASHPHQGDLPPPPPRLIALIQGRTLASIPDTENVLNGMILLFRPPSPPLLLPPALSLQLAPHL